jgi:hypothetical protein
LEVSVATLQVVGGTSARSLLVTKVAVRFAPLKLSSTAAAEKTH